MSGSSGPEPQPGPLDRAASFPFHFNRLLHTLPKE